MKRKSRRLCLAALVFVVAASSVAYLVAVLGQRHVVAKIRSIGGVVIYEREYGYLADWEASACETGEQGPYDPPAPRIMERILGPDATSVSSIALPRYATSSDSAVRAPITDEFLESVSALRAVRSLDLTFQPVTDVGLEHIRAMPRLEVLKLYGTQVTDESIRTLFSLPSLTSLHIGATRITKRGIKELAGLSQLRALTLSRDQLEEIGGGDSAYAIFASGVVRIWVEEITPTGGHQSSNVVPPSLIQATEPRVGADSK